MREGSGPSSARSKRDEADGRARPAPRDGAAGYTESFREPSGDVVEVSVVSALEARGPD